MVVFSDDAVTKELFPGVIQKHYLDKKTGTGSVSMGIVTIAPNSSLKPHHHRVEDAMIVISGKGKFILEEREYKIEEGMALLAPAQKQHYLLNDGDEPLIIVYTWPSVEVERYI